MADVFLVKKVDCLNKLAEDIFCVVFFESFNTLNSFTEISTSAELHHHVNVLIVLE